MKKILIRVESHSSSWLWWMETRIKDFLKKTNNDITILSNRNLKTYFNNSFIKSNYFKINGILRDILYFRKYNIIESNWHRDNIIAILNFLLYYPLYKIMNIKLFIVIHWVIWIQWNKWMSKIVYNIIFFIWILISDKLIFVSEEVLDFIKNYFKLVKKVINKKKLIIVNYIEVNNNNILEGTELKAILLSRIENTKLKWIINAIEFCNNYNIKLDIYWWGNALDELKVNYKNINFYWEVDNKTIDYCRYNISFWMWRSLLEWILNWLIWILIWYVDIIDLIEADNIKKNFYSNFSWRWIKKENDLIIYKKIIKSLENKKYIDTKNEIEKIYWLNNFKDYWN